MKVGKWDIVPYTRVGALAFDIDQDEARSILGKESLKSFDKDENETTLYWQDNALQLVFDGKGLSEVGFYPDIENIFIEDILLDWNDTTPIFKWLLENDPSAMMSVGIFIFFKYGISALGLEFEETSGKAISIFRKGVWLPDDYLLRSVEKSEFFQT